MFSDWIQAQNVDILTLQELVDWDEDYLRLIAGRDWNMGGVAFQAVESGYNLGVVVRRGLYVRVVGRRTKGFHHGALHVVVRIISSLLLTLPVCDQSLIIDSPFDSTFL